jgi:hypothetical protein
MATYEFAGPCTADHSSIMDEIIVRPGEVVTVDKATTTVLTVGVHHTHGACTPSVLLADGRRIEGEAAFYIT